MVRNIFRTLQDARQYSKVYLNWQLKRDFMCNYFFVLFIIFYNIGICQIPNWQNKGVKRPNIPTDYNLTGLYRKEIDIPKDWHNMLPTEFDITPCLQVKNSFIAFQAPQWSDGSYLKDQDHWRMSSLTGDVFLEAVPHPPFRIAAKNYRYNFMIKLL